MKLVIQRVNWANISCLQDQEINLVGNIQKGIIVYVGFEKGDRDKREQLLDKASERIVKLPIFDDEKGRIKKSLSDIDGHILLVPNFTLAGVNKKGNSMDYTNAEEFSKAKQMFEELYKILKDKVNHIDKGCFGQYMKIQSEVDGPVNLILSF